MGILRIIVVSYPISDKHRHDYTNPNCRCKPVCEINDEQWIICHRAFDRREILEEIGITSPKKKWAVLQYENIEAQQEEEEDGEE